LNKTCLILIHGFGGNSAEVTPLAGFLSHKGYHTICPQLKGHTGIKKDLKGVSGHDWLKSVEDELVKAGKEFDTICIIGFSMGGLIAIHLAVKYDIAALVTINTPVYYWDFKRIAWNIIHDLRTGEFTNIRRYRKSSAGLPLEAMLNFKMLLNRTKPLIGQVKCPLYVLQGSDDDTVKPKSANYLYDHAGSSSKRIDFFVHSGHAMLQSQAAPTALQSINGFLEEVLKY
jgi:carboxylesterase